MKTILTNAFLGSVIFVCIIAGFVPALIGFVLRLLWCSGMIGAAMVDELIERLR